MEKMFCFCYARLIQFKKKMLMIYKGGQHQFQAIATIMQLCVVMKSDCIDLLGYKKKEFAKLSLIHGQESERTN